MESLTRGTQASAKPSEKGDAAEGRITRDGFKEILAQSKDAISRADSNRAGQAGPKNNASLKKDDRSDRAVRDDRAEKIDDKPKTSDKPENADKSNVADKPKDSERSKRGKTKTGNTGDESSEESGVAAGLKNLLGVAAIQDTQPVPVDLEGAAGEVQGDVPGDDKPVTANTVNPDTDNVDEGQKPLQGADPQKQKIVATDNTAETAKAADGARKSFLSALNTAAADEQTQKNPTAALNEELNALVDKAASSDVAPKGEKSPFVNDEKSSAVNDAKARDEIFSRLKDGLGKSQPEGVKVTSAGAQADKKNPADLKAAAPETPSEADKGGPEHGQSENKPDDASAAKVSTDTRPVHLKLDNAAEIQRTEVKQVHEPVKTVINIDDKTLSLIRKSDTSIEVKIDPKGIGKIDIDINVDKGTVNAHISAADSDTKTLLENNIKSIIEALSKDGLNVAGFSVSLKDRGDGGTKDGRGDGGKNGGRKEDEISAIERPSSVHSTDGKLSIFV
jgi:hypothetical protein